MGKDSNKVVPTRGTTLKEVPKKVRPKSTLDPRLENGPITDRGCTDIICCLLYICFIALCAYITITAFTKGDPWRLAQPFDVDSNPCGAKGYPTSDYPYAYFFNPTVGLDYVICLKSCPNWDLTQNSPTPMSLGECYLGPNATTLTGHTSSGPRVCDTNLVILNVSDYSIWQNTLLGTSKDIKLYRTEPLLQRFCAPRSFNDASKYFYTNAINSSNTSDKMDQYFSDLRNSWGIILISFGFAFVLSLLYLVILRFCTGFFVWTTILLFLALMLGMAILLHVRSNKYENSQTNTGNGSSTSTTSSSLYWSAVVCYILFACSFCAVCCFFKTIELCIAVLKSAALFVANHFCVVVVPVVFGLVIFGYAMFALFVLLFLWSIGEVTKRDGLPLGQVNWDTNIRRLVWVHFYSVLLNVAIMLYHGQFIICGAAVLWYFNHGENATHPTPLRTATWWSFRYHFGSIVFAGFLLSIIWTIKIILLYVKEQAEKVQAKNPTASLVKMVLCVMMCLVQCFERFIKFISKTGMIMIAITGKSFCGSCKDGLMLLLRHPLKFGLVGVLGEIFVFLGEFFVAILTTLVGYIIISTSSSYTEVLYSPLVPCCFFFLIGYIVGSIFMSVYGLAADAIMCCYLVDKDLVEKQQKPVSRVPEPLREFFEENKTDSGFSSDDEVKK